MTWFCVPAAVLATALAVGCSRNSGRGDREWPQPLTPNARETPMSSPPPQSPRSATQPTGDVFAGTLRGGVIAIGAETTGWVLQTDDHRRIDVDVSKAADAATKLDGERVVIHGTMGQAKWLERGPKPLITADRIEPALPTASK